MVVEKANSYTVSNRTPPARSMTRIRAARFQPTAINRIQTPTKTSTRKNLNSNVTTIYKLNLPATASSNGNALEEKNEMAPQDVEAMDIDYVYENGIACSQDANVTQSASHSKGKSRYSESDKTKGRNGLEESTQIKETCTKNETNTANSCSSKLKRKRQAYIILHVSHVRIGDLVGKASQPIRIQAHRILIKMELKSTVKDFESLTFRIPCEDLSNINVNLSEPPFVIVVMVNKTQSLSLLKGMKNRFKLLQSDGKLRVVMYLRYEAIPNDVKRQFEILRSELDASVHWNEISSEMALQVLNEDDILSIEELKYQHEKIEKKKIDDEEKEATSIVCSPVHKRRRNMINVNDKHKSNGGRKNEILCSKDDEQKYGKPDDSKEGNYRKVNKSRDGRKTKNFVTEQSFEESRVEMMRMLSLENDLTEKEIALKAQKRMVELRDLELQEERNKVRELRVSLREKETHLETANRKLVEQSRQKAIDESRTNDLEQELSELSLRLINNRTENEEMVKELEQTRDRFRESQARLSESEANLLEKQQRISRTEEDIERERRTVEELRRDLEQKHLDLSQERERRQRVSACLTDLRSQMVTTRTEYENRIRRSNEEYQRMRRNYEECDNQLLSTRQQLEDANRALHRAQETVDEYSRMQPRDWTIARDEIEITERVLGQGAWGWVKEGVLRGTSVAVKQMHELIISPHNQRLFEREMQIASRCRHPNLLQFIGATNDNGVALLVTELMDIDLRSILEQRSLSHDEVVSIALDISKGLNYLHLTKPFPIIHRDISSTNVLLWQRGDIYHAKLSDYGAANFMRQCMTVSPGACIYAAPESTTSQQSTKLDVYSFGLLLCEMSIRQLPVPGETRDQIRSITNARLRELAERSTHVTSEARPTMAEILTVLQRESANSQFGTVAVNNRQILVT